MEINKLYLKRYQRFIENSKSKNVAKGETHHIIPRCMGGDDSKENLIKLCYRSHYIAHWLLYKAYPENNSLFYAFWAMCNKNSNIEIKKNVYFRLRNSTTYQKLKEEASKRTAEMLTGFVTVRDESGNKVRMTSEEYIQNKESYNFHTSGKVVCVDTETNEFVSIPCNLYHSSERYKKIIDVSKFIKSAYVDGILVKKSLNEFKELKKAGHQVKFPFYGDIESIKNTMVVLDTNDNIKKKIPVDEYYNNPLRYITSTKGKVLAYNKDTGVKSVVSANDYRNNANIVGHTYGLTTVFDTMQNKFVQIKRDEFDPKIHRGPAAGKVNAINKQTGERIQLDKETFKNNRDIYEAVGNISLIFKCKNRISLKIKNISIYEWINKPEFKDLWEIIEIEKFSDLITKIKGKA